MTDEREPSSGESKAGEAIRKLGYTKSLLFVFVIPFLFLFRTILRNVQKAPFFVSVAAVCVLGWGWSMLLTYQHWWVFPERFILGYRPLPYLPVEEFLIYPIGGAFSIFLYALPTRKWPVATSAPFFWFFIVAVTAAFSGLAWWKHDTRPFYLYSQLVLYNGLSFVLAPFSASRVNIKGLLISALTLGAVGSVWDYFAFRYAWWVYYAITNVKVAGVPVEDVNFYLMAPAAAIALYVALCRMFGQSQVPAEK